MMQNKLNIANPESLDMGEMLGISPQRMDEISKGLDEMSRLAGQNAPELIYASGVFRYIENICNTNEELIWAITNHIMYMARTGRMADNVRGTMEQIKKYGPPKHLQ